MLKNPSSLGAWVNFQIVADQGAGVRAAAVLLAKQGLSRSADAVELLFEVAQRDEHVFVRRIAMNALASVDDELLTGFPVQRFIDLTVDALRAEMERQDPSRTVVGTCCQILSRWAQLAVAAVPTLRKLAADPEPVLSSCAKRAIDIIQEFLGNSLGSESPVRSALTEEGSAGTILPHIALPNGPTKASDVAQEGRMPVASDLALMAELTTLCLSHETFRQIIVGTEAVAQNDFVPLSCAARERVDYVLKLRRRLMQVIPLPQAVGAFIQRPQAMFDGRSPIELIIEGEYARVFGIVDNAFAP